MSTMEDISEEIGRGGRRMEMRYLLIYLVIAIAYNTDGDDLNTQFIKLESIYFKKSLLELVDD